MKIIAESAFNHQGSLDMLKQLARVSKNAGADYFTFQMMQVDHFCTPNYQKYELYKATEFTLAQWGQLFDYCSEIEMEMIPCVLDSQSLEFCIESGVFQVKIHATDIANFPLLNRIALSPIEKVLLETQCATMVEVRRAIQTIGSEKIEAIFSGYSNYPSEVEELNLNSIEFLRSKFGFKTGFADHSTDKTEIPLMLLAKDCDYLEKHITVSRNNRNYDWQVSLYPEEFAMMIQNIKHYSKALGKLHKHPTEHEKLFRPIMYKRHIPGRYELLRADEGLYPIEKLIEEISEQGRYGIAIIARLKSERLKKKVLLEIDNRPMILGLYDRLTQAKNVDYTALCTSELAVDDELVSVFGSAGLPTFRGDAESVIDRLIDFALANSLSGVFRVTGDNPLTDVDLIDEMVKLMTENELDYVKVNNVPFGVGSELFSLKYLWKLYLKLESTLESEYLSWYVQNDDECVKGCIDVESENIDFDRINFSVDYQEDFDRVSQLKETVGKPLAKITLSDMLKGCEGIELVNTDKFIKLPEEETVLLSDYLGKWKTIPYKIRKSYQIA